MGDESIGPQTLSLIRIFMKSAGETETPQKFLYWAGISMVAAAIERNVWMDPDGWSKVFPNLYTFLIGPSASGKGRAMNLAGVYLHGAVVRLGASVHTYRGRLTFAELYNQLYAGDDKPCKPIYLVMPELSNSIGRDDLGAEMLTTLTDMYEGHAYTPYSRGTAKDGTKIFREPVVNIIAGTTIEGFRDAIRPTDLENGFIGRIALVIANYVNNKVPQPTKQAFNQWYDYIIHRLCKINTQYAGEMEFSQEAQALFNAWYVNRPVARHPQMEPGHHRLPVTVRKLAMVHHLASRPDTENPTKDQSWRLVNAKALDRAIKDAEGMMPSAEIFIEEFLSKQENPVLFEVARMLCAQGRVYETVLRARFGARGLAIAIEDLTRMDVIRKDERRVLSGGTKAFYEWTGPKGKNGFRKWFKKESQEPVVRVIRKGLW